MKKKQLLVMVVLALVCATGFADDPAWVPTKHDVVGTWQTGTNWFGDVTPSYENFQSAIVANQATINVNTFVKVYELAIGTPWDGAGYNSPTAKKGGTLNIGAGGQVWTTGSMYVAHLGSGTLNVSGGGSIRVGGEFSICKYFGGNGLALFDNVQFNVGAANISTGGTLTLKNSSYLKVWEPNSFNCTGVVNLYDTTVYVAIKGTVNLNDYAGKIIPLSGAGTLAAVQDGDFTNIFATGTAPTAWIPTKHDVVGTWQTGTNWFGDVTPTEFALVGNQATINVNTAVQVTDLAIGTPWDNGGYLSPTAKQGGTLNIGTGGSVHTTNNFYVAHFGDGTLNVPSGTYIQANEFSVSKTSGQGLALFDGGWANVGSVVIGADGEVILKGGQYFKVWSTNFTVDGVFDIADEDSRLEFVHSEEVDPSVYANVTAMHGAGDLYAVYNFGTTIVRAEPNENIECGLTADLTGDCQVGSEDLALLISEWLLYPDAPIIWEATMATDPVLSGDWKVRDGYNNYSISGGKMILNGGNAVIDASPAMDLNKPLDIQVTLRATTTTPSPIFTEASAPSIWANMDTDQAAYYAGLRFSIYKVSSTEQVLAVISNNATVLGQYGGLGTGMISVHAVIEPDGTAGTITLDVTDGVTTYSDQVLSYTNNISGTTVHRYVTISSLGNAGEIDYIKAETTRVPLYNLAGDATIDLEDFAVMASEWLKKYVWVPIVP